MKRTTLLALGLALVASPALAQQRTSYDSSGRVSGRSTTDSGGSTTFYDPSGRVSARSSTNGNQTTIYDARGRSLGRMDRWPLRGTITDPK
jgi:YD repeat-containing protein